MFTACIFRSLVNRFLSITWSGIYERYSDILPHNLLPANRIKRRRSQSKRFIQLEGNARPFSAAKIETLQDLNLYFRDKSSQFRPRLQLVLEIKRNQSIASETYDFSQSSGSEQRMTISAFARITVISPSGRTPVSLLKLRENRTNMRKDAPTCPSCLSYWH